MSAAVPPDPTQRFSERVADYVRYRPGYPADMVRVLASETGLSSESVVADAGSGTGISSALFLALGCSVYGIEPNAAMRAAAEARFIGESRFTSVDGTAEETRLAAGSVDLVSAGQAFHWFDRARARAEFRRILRPGGSIAIFFNARLTDASPFLMEYERLLQRWGTDYASVDHTRLDPDEVRAFIGPDAQLQTFSNEQTFDVEGLKGRLLSASYTPGPGDPAREPMLRDLERLFEEHNEQGLVRFLYRTELYVGSV